MHPVAFVFGGSLSAFSNELTHERVFDINMWQRLINEDESGLII